MVLPSASREAPLWPPPEPSFSVNILLEMDFQALGFLSKVGLHRTVVQLGLLQVQIPENLIHASLSKGEHILVHFDQETKSLASGTADTGAQTVSSGPTSSLPSFGSVSPVLVVPSVLVMWHLQSLQLLRFKVGGKEQNYLLLQSQERAQWTSLAPFSPVSISKPVIVPMGIQYCDGQVGVPPRPQRLLLRGEIRSYSQKRGQGNRTHPGVPYVSSPRKILVFPVDLGAMKGKN